MKVKQYVREAGSGQHLPFYPALRTHEERLNVRTQPLNRSSDREAGVQVATCAAPREHNPHVEPANGFVAPTPTTRSLTLPMFTSTPVKNIVSTRFERP